MGFSLSNHAFGGTFGVLWKAPFVPGLVHDVEGVAGLVLLDHHLALCEVHLDQGLAVVVTQDLVFSPQQSVSTAARGDQE